MRRLLIAVLGMAVALGLAACTPGESPVVFAEFDDVADLNVRGVVKVSDVPVGSIRSITLTEDYRARVEMVITRDMDLPSELAAELRKTAVLGERYVNLIPLRDSGGVWESGGSVTTARLVPELEELVGAGSELLAAVAVDKVAAAIDAGAQGLDGRGETLKQLLDDLGLIVGTYNTNSADLVRLIDGFDRFFSTVGPHADLHGRAMGEVARATQALAEEDERLLDALAAVRELSRTGTDIMRTHRARFDRFFATYRAITAELVARGADLDRLFAELAKHNHNTLRGVNAEHAQVLLDFIACGENDTPGDPVRACTDPPQGRSRPEPRPRMGGGS
jgi:phospholipid/cholesterol/gamma-HCH transport system substrate-binding protein